MFGARLHRYYFSSTISGVAFSPTKTVQDYNGANVGPLINWSYWFLPLKIGCPRPKSEKIKGFINPTNSSQSTTESTLFHWPTRFIMPARQRNWFPLVQIKVNSK